MMLDEMRKDAHGTSHHAMLETLMVGGWVGGYHNAVVPLGAYLALRVWC